jgi:hypothetical protein
MSDTYRIIISGSRLMRDEGPIRLALRELGASADSLDVKGGVTVVHGGAEGCDFLADFVVSREYPHFKLEQHPADWDRWGKRAGPLRNKHMIDAGADVVLAFPSIGGLTNGTRGTISLAIDAGIPVRVYPVRV